MAQTTHAQHPDHAPPGPGTAGYRWTAFQATLHCMTGCAIGEIAGLVIGTTLGLGLWQTVALAVGLAFVTGFGLTMVPLLRSGMNLRAELGVAFAADFVSVTVMEITDNAVMLAVPGAMTAGLGDPLFWGTMAVAFVVAFAAAYPVNLWLISRGKGHAGVHGLHAQH